MALLEIKNLQLDFVSHDGSARAVDGVSLTLAAGETAYFVGAAYYNGDCTEYLFEVKELP